LEQRWRLTSDGVAARTVRIDLLLQPPDDAPASPADQLVVLQHVQFSEPPRTIELKTDLFGRSAGDERLRLVVTRPGSREERLLEPPGATLVLFAGEPAPGGLSSPSEGERVSPRSLVAAGTFVWVAGVGIAMLVRRRRSALQAAEAPDSTSRS
jgi:hypothetical protein